MEHLILVERDAGGAGAQLRDARLARFARTRPAVGGWRAQVAQLVGAPEFAHYGPAEIARCALALPDDASSRAACFATPVYVQIGRYGGRIQRESLITLTAADASELLRAFETDMPVSGGSLHRLPDGGLLALIAPPGDVRTFDPEDCFDAPIDAVLPEGDGGAALRRAATELEIWLHTLPLNEARAVRGAPPITTLWLWGLGARLLPTPLDSARRLLVASTDAFLRGMGVLLGATMHDNAACTIDDMVSRNPTCVVADATGALTTEAVDAVRDGRIARLDVVSRTHVLYLTRLDLYKFWRRTRSP